LVGWKGIKTVESSKWKVERKYKSRCQASGVRKRKDSGQLAANSLQEKIKNKSKGKETEKAEKKRAFKCIWFLYSFAFTDN